MDTRLGESRHREEFVSAAEEFRSAEIVGTDLPLPGRNIDSADHTNRSDYNARNADQTASKSFDETDQYLRDSGHVSDHYDLVVDFNSHEADTTKAHLNDQPCDQPDDRSPSPGGDQDGQTQYSCIIVVTSDQSNLSDANDYRTTVSLPYFEENKSTGNTRRAQSETDNTLNENINVHNSRISEHSEGNLIQIKGDIHNEGTDHDMLGEHEGGTPDNSHESAKISTDHHLTVVDPLISDSPVSQCVIDSTGRQTESDLSRRSNGDASHRLPVDFVLKSSRESSPRIPVDSILRVGSDSSPKSNGIQVNSRLSSQSGSQDSGERTKLEWRGVGGRNGGAGGVPQPSVSTKPVLSPARENRLLCEESSDQICIDIDQHSDASKDGTREDGGGKEENSQIRGRRRRHCLSPVSLVSLIKVVDLGFHATMLALLLYATYLSAVFCQQSLDSSLCLKNSSLSPQILGKPEWTMPVGDWSLIFSIFHSVYFFLAILADLFFFNLLSKIKKYILTVLPVERGFLVVLLITDSALYIFSVNLGESVGGVVVTVLVTLAATCLILDTGYLLPRLLDLSKLDLGWLLRSSRLLTKWRPSLHLILVISITLYNLVSTVRYRLTPEMIPLAVFGVVYSSLIIFFIVVVVKRKKSLITFLTNLKGSTEAPNTPREWRSEAVEEGQMDPKEWAETRSDLALSILGLASVNYLSVAPVAQTLNFIFNKFIL